MTQIGLGVQKVCFCIFFRFLLSARVKKEPKKNSKNFIAFSCLEWLKNSHFFFSKISKSPKVGTVLGPFGPKTQNTTHQSSINTITAFLLSYFIIIQKIIKNGQAVLQIFNFEKSSDLIGRAVFGHFQPNTNFPEKSDSATFYPLYPSNFMQNEPDKSVDPHNFWKKKFFEKKINEKKFVLKNIGGYFWLRWELGLPRIISTC